MKIPISISLLLLCIVAGILIYISRQNNIVGNGAKQYGYLHFNWSKPAESNTIMDYWRKDEGRMQSVKNIITADYFFMALYCSYFCCSIIFRKRKITDRPLLKRLLSVALGLILLGTLIDVVQDYIIYRYVSSTQAVGDMRYYTFVKWGALVLGVLILLLSFIPKGGFKHLPGIFLRFLSQFLKSLWLFFPGILFLLLPVFCFWMLGQGKDIIVAYIDNQSRATGFFAGNFFRVIFFVAVGFWVYVSWYSSRIIAYIKKNQQLELQQQAGNAMALPDFLSKKNYYELGINFLEGAPRLIGNSCFLILELAVLQSPILSHPLHSAEAWLIFFILLLVTWHIDVWIGKQTKWMSGGFNKSFITLLSGFITLLIIFSCFNLPFIRDTGTGALWILFGLLLFFHAIFMYYVNLRRQDLYKTKAANSKKAPETNKSILKRTMEYFCIPLEEIGYYRWFLIICGAGIILYIMAITLLWFARYLTPFPVLILAFTALLIIGNCFTAFSIRYRLNFHFILFIMALVIGTKETHQVRRVTQSTVYNRPDLKKYLNAWLADRLNKLPATDSSSTYDMYFVMANGGASRSGYWTAAVLGRLEDASILKNTADRFSDHVFCLSGTSGGGVGVAGFFSLLNKNDTAAYYAATGMNFLKQDYFSYTIARMLGPDFFKYILPFKAMDRAAALEEAFEQPSKGSATTFPVAFKTAFSEFPALNSAGQVIRPLLFVNTTRMQDGNPGVITNLSISADSANPTPIFNKRVDVVGLLTPGEDISIASGSILGARFPYLSPAGEINNNYFVDGGYFDNSGAGVIQELIRGILKIAREDRSGVLWKKIKRLNFKVIHIVNSPVIETGAKQQAVAPIKNDLLSPVLTIVGAYDMQTTVNDVRLKNYIEDIKAKDSLSASYTRVSLYKFQPEWDRDTVLNKRFKSEPAYAMNWFISDTTVRRIDERLYKNDSLDFLLRPYKR